jgi:hypothetical protein
VSPLTTVRSPREHAMTAAAALPIVRGSDAVGLFFEDPAGTRLEVSCAHGAAEAAADAAFGSAPTCGFF